MGLPDQHRRVLFITYEFPPSLEVGAHASKQLARYLPLYGWEPLVLTVHERYYPDRDTRSQSAFPGRVVRTRVFSHPLDVCSRLKSRLGFSANRLDTAVQREAEWSGEGIGTVRRWILSLLKTPDVYTGWILPAVLTGLREIRRQGVTHLCSSAPYWSNHLVGLILSHLTGLTWTAHFRDPWVGIPQWKPTCAASQWIERTLEGMVVRRAAAVVCVTELHTNLFRQRYPGAPPGKFVTIPNGFDEAEWNGLGTKNDNGRPAEQNRFVIRYAGSLYQRRNPLPLFRALETLVDSREIDRSSITIDLVGWCDLAEGRRVQEMAEECRIPQCVTFTGPLNRADTLRSMTQADLLLLLAEAQPYQIPGKTYEYLRAGRPILALTSDDALAQLLRRTGGAWVVPPGDDEGVVAALREAYTRWRRGERGPVADRTFVASFDRRLLAGRLAEQFDKTSHGVGGSRVSNARHPQARGLDEDR